MSATYSVIVAYTNTMGGPTTRLHKNKTKEQVLKMVGEWIDSEWVNSPAGKPASIWVEAA
jgi:hypothetical protein